MVGPPPSSAGGPPPRYLVVGAGAVGQPLAAHLAAGGAEVTFLVKEKYARDLRAGPLTLERLPLLPLLGRPARTEFRAYGVVAGAKEAAASEWDAVILTVASPALRQGAWLQELVDALIKPRPRTSLVFLTSGMSDRGLLDGCGVPCEQLVQGGIPYISWQAPLPGERFSPVAPAGPGKTLAAIGYVLPSFMLSGPSPRASAIAAVLTKGGMPCSVVPDVEAELAFAEATLMPILVALEIEGWSFARMRRGGRLSATAGAIRECLGVAQAEAGPSLLWRLVAACLMHRWLLWLLLILAPVVMPFDIEAYLKYHFCKVGDQTKQYIDDFLRHGRASGGPAAMPRLGRLVRESPRWGRPTAGGEAAEGARS